jgi:hypothetical protein
MKTIWKFEIPVEDNFVLQMPQGAEVLSVDVQGTTPCLWALVDPDAPKVDQHFQLRGTGHSCEGVNAEEFVGTFMVHGGNLVFHVFTNKAKAAN